MGILSLLNVLFFVVYSGEEHERETKISNNINSTAVLNMP